MKKISYKPIMVFSAFLCVFLVAAVYSAKTKETAPLLNETIGITTDIETTDIELESTVEKSSNSGNSDESKLNDGSIQVEECNFSAFPHLLSHNHHC